MKTTPLIALLTIAAAATTAAPAAGSGAPRVKGGVECHQVLKRSYKLSQVVRHGVPIKITCTGAARFFAVPEFVAMTQQDRDLTDIGGHSIPPVSTTRTKIKVGMGTQREDGAFWSEPGDWGRTVIVR